MLGHVLTVDEDRRTHRRGAVYITDGRIERVTDESTPRADRIRRCAARTSRRCRRARPHRPPQPSRVQHLAAVGRPAGGVRHALPVAAGRVVRARRLESGPGARHRGTGRDVAVRGGQGGGRRRHRHTGFAAADPHLPRLDAAQRREREVRAGSTHLPVGAPGDRRPAEEDRTPVEGRSRVLLPPRRGCRHEAARGVSLPRPAQVRARRSRRDPFDRTLQGRLPYMGGARRRIDRVVAVLEPLAVRRHHRRAECPPPRPARVSRLRLDAVGDAQPARRAQGRGAMEPGCARRRVRTGGSGRACDRQPGRHARGAVGSTGRPPRRGWARGPGLLQRDTRGSVAVGARVHREARTPRDRRRPTGVREPRPCSSAPG